MWNTTPLFHLEKCDFDQYLRGLFHLFHFERGIGRVERKRGD